MSKQTLCPCIKWFTKYVSTYVQLVMLVRGMLEHGPNHLCRRMTEQELVDVILTENAQVCESVLSHLGFQWKSINMLLDTYTRLAADGTTYLQLRLGLVMLARFPQEGGNNSKKSWLRNTKNTENTEKYWKKQKYTKKK